MRATWALGRLGAGAVFVAWLVGAARADESAKGKDDLRQRALALNEITGDDPMTGQILAFLENKADGKKVVAEAYKLATQADKDKKEPVFNVNATWILARTAHGLKESKAAEYFYRQHSKQALKLGSAEKYARACSSLMDLFNQDKQYAKAEDVGKEVLELNGAKLGWEKSEVEVLQTRILRKIAQTQARSGKPEDALKLLDNYEKKHPQYWLALGDTKAWVLRQAGRNADAAKVYEGLLEAVNKKVEDKKRRDLLANDIRYTLSGVYVELKQVDKAAEQLKKLLEKEPDSPTYNNDLGFIWADHGMNLEESEKLIRKALAKDRERRHKATPDIKPADDKDSAAYLDSLGWVLFKRKKYKEALEPLLEAVKQEEGQHIEIYDHLGDVYLALGQKAKAVEAWKKGLTCNPISRRDEPRKAAVEEKIKKHDKAE